MPGRDGTGPLGPGVMNGRGLGLCTDRLGLAHRRGRGRGFGRGFAVNQTSLKTQKELLQEQRDVLKSRLDIIEKRLETS